MYEAGLTPPVVRLPPLPRVTVAPGSHVHPYPAPAQRKERTFNFDFPDCDKLPPPVLPFIDVSFSYNGKKEDYLYHKLNLGIDCDSRIALVGACMHLCTHTLPALQSHLRMLLSLCRRPQRRGQEHVAEADGWRPVSDGGERDAAPAPHHRPLLPAQRRLAERRHDGAGVLQAHLPEHAHLCARRGGLALIPWPLRCVGQDANHQDRPAVRWPEKPPGYRNHLHDEPQPAAAGARRAWAAALGAT